MPEFGEALRAFRLRRGLSQGELVTALDGLISRSTIAGLETGHQGISPRVWDLLSQHFPEDVESLRPSYERARADQETAAAQRQQPPGRPRSTKVEQPADYVFERYDVVYVLRESRSPEEIIELRRLRSLSKGAHDFGLSFGRDAEQFEVETEVLFGGEIVGFDIQELPSKTLIMQLLDFGRTLRKGERHNFGIRYWVQRDPDPQDNGHVLIESDYAMEEVGVHVNFWGTENPRLCWAFEGLPDAAMAPGEPSQRVELELNQHSTVSVDFRKPVTGTFFGVAWRW